jgi:hypothetical protein
MNATKLEMKVLKRNMTKYASKQKHGEVLTGSMTFSVYGLEIKVMYETFGGKTSLIRKISESKYFKILGKDHNLENLSLFKVFS